MRTIAITLAVTLLLTASSPRLAIADEPKGDEKTGTSDAARTPAAVLPRKEAASTAARFTAEEHRLQRAWRMRNAGMILVAAGLVLGITAGLVLGTSRGQNCVGTDCGNAFGEKTGSLAAGGVLAGLGLAGLVTGAVLWPLGSERMADSQAKLGSASAPARFSAGYGLRF
jgi:hypothetical protein